MSLSRRNIPLGQIAPYITAKIDAEELNANNFISADNMEVDRGGITESVYAPSKGRATRFEKGDVLVSNIRPYFKKIWKATFEGGCSNDVFVLRAKDDLVHPDYLYYYLSKQDFFNYMMAGANGTKMPRGNKKAIPKYKVQLPPLPTQRKIAGILSTYDDLIENNLKRIKLLEEKAQLTYEEWFVRMKFPGHESTRINKEIGLPEGWEMKKLGDCCELIMGQSPKSEFYNDEGKGLPFHQGVKDYGYRFPINTSWSTSGSKIAKENAILFSVRAPVGRLNVAIEKIILGRGLASINHNQGWNSFLFYQLQKIFFKDNLIGGGAIFNAVTKSDMERIELIHATDQITNSFNNLAFRIDESIKSLTKQNQLLKEARNILLPRLMTGMIDVEKLDLNAFELGDTEGMMIAAEESVKYKNQ